MIAGLLFALALPVGAQRGGGGNGGGGFGGNSRNDPFGTGRNQKNPFPKEPKQQKKQKERPACVADIQGQKYPKKNPTHICEQNNKGKWGWQKIKKEDKKPAESAS